MNERLSSCSWISSSICGGPRSTAPYLRREFRMDRALKSARLTATALGLYEVEINGTRVGDRVFAPGWTDYRVRVPVQSYDVTKLLREGQNAIGAILGDGWYCGYVAWSGRQVYGQKPEFLAVLEVEFEDGTSQRVESEGNWRTASGPILENDLIMGETYDARLESEGWSLPGFDDSAWLPVQTNATRKLILDTIDYPPVKRLGELAPSRLAHNVFDMGQNFTGRVRIRVNAPRGTTITIRHAEILNPEGRLYTENLRHARATDLYTCKGRGEEVWEPRFTFHGFRYVEIDGLPTEGTIEVTGIVLHSDTPPTGTFACSNLLLNQLQQNIVWGQKSNFLEIPMDCPQRDERLGWTGDAQAFIRTAAFNMDVRRFFHKWLQDLRDAQDADGAVPAIIPQLHSLGLPIDGGPAWADATFICPWTIYLCYGDTDILREHYTCMVRYLDYLAANKVKNHIRMHPDKVDANTLSGGFGDWLALDGSGRREGGTPKDLIGTAFYAHGVDITAKTAALLGHEADAARYRKLHGEIVDAFVARFLTAEGLVLGGTQTGYVLALHFNLVPEHLRAIAADELVRLIVRNGHHIGTGFVGTPYIQHVLEATGHLDIAYKLLEQETFPSWLFPVKNGATTIWERWDGWTAEKGFQEAGMNSFNHYAYGAVSDWMVSTVAGLQFDPAQPGYRHIVFKPRPGGTLTWAEARLKTPHGETSIHWELKDTALVLELVVPAGTTASLDLPSTWISPRSPLGAGTHHLSLQSAFPTDQDQGIGKNFIPTHVATDEAMLVKR